MQNEADVLREMEYESIYKGEKVNYILMKQGFLDLEEIIKENRAKVDFPVDDLISAQKAVSYKHNTKWQALLSQLTGSRLRNSSSDTIPR